MPSMSVPSPGSSMLKSSSAKTWIRSDGQLASIDVDANCILTTPSLRPSNKYHFFFGSITQMAFEPSWQEADSFYGSIKVAHYFTQSLFQPTYTLYELTIQTVITVCINHTMRCIKIIILQNVISY